MVPFKNQVLHRLSEIKQETDNDKILRIPIRRGKEVIGYLRAITSYDYNKKESILFLSNWRRQSEEWFPAQFQVTTKGTKIWLQERLLETPDRILFFIETPEYGAIGHVGLFRFDFVSKACEIDNVIRGVNVIPGIMTSAIDALMRWSKQELKVKDFYLEVFSDNEKAISLYKRCGFREVKRVPLVKKIEANVTSWIETEKKSKTTNRHNVYMKKW